VLKMCMGMVAVERFQPTLTGIFNYGNRHRSILIRYNA
jgi:hypothetical protein